MKKGSGDGDGDRGRRDTHIRADQTIGEILLAAREGRGLTLEDVGQETKIPREMLEYLETDNFEAIPAKVYVKGFLRSYAELLELDVIHIMSKFEVQTGQTYTSKGDHWEIETEVIEEKLQSPNIIRRFVVPAVVVIAAVIVIVKLGTRERPVAEPPTEKSVLEEIGGTDDVPRQTPVDSLREEERLETERHNEVIDGDRSERPASDDAVTPVQATQVAESEPEELTPLRLELIAHQNERTWFDLLTVSTVDGRSETTAYDFILLPGETKTFEATDSFILRRIGNAGGFTMKLNDVQLPSLGARSEVKYDVTITRGNLPDR